MIKKKKNDAALFRIVNRQIAVQKSEAKRRQTAQTSEFCSTTQNEL